MKCFFTVTFYSLILILFCNRSLAQCNATDALAFTSCVNNPPPTAILMFDDMTVNLDGEDLSDFTIDVNGHTLTITGNPTVNGSTNFTSSAINAAGSLVIINSHNETATFTSSGSSPDFDWDDLNLQMGSYTGLHEAAIAAGANTLPIVLNNFRVENEGNAIALIWQTSTELNNAKFIIETSHQGETFQRIGEVTGAGTTTEPQNYSFTHQTPSAGINYYRLKQLDFDGTFEYSKVIAIEAPGSNDIFAFPNPARDKISVQYDQSKGAGNIQLLDALGRRIQANIVGAAGNYEVTLPESLARGTYWLRVERGGKVQTLPVVKE